MAAGYPSRRLSQTCYKVSRSATLTVLSRPRNVRAFSSITSPPLRLAAARMSLSRDPLTVMRYLDLGVLAFALPVFVVAGLPLLGWVVGAGVWLMWRGIATWADRRAASSSDPRVVAGYEAGSMIGRGWLMGLTLLAAGLALGSDVGLSAAVLDVLLFTIFFTFKVIARPLP